MLVFARICSYLFHFAGSDVFGIDPADSPAFSMNFEHDLGGTFPRQGEEQLQHLDHELHRSVIIVVHDDLEHRRRFDLRLARLEDSGAVGFVSHGSAVRRTLKEDNLRFPFRGWNNLQLIWTSGNGFSSPSNA